MGYSVLMFLGFGFGVWGLGSVCLFFYGFGVLGFGVWELGFHGLSVLFFSGLRILGFRFLGVHV